MVTRKKNTQTNHKKESQNKRSYKIAADRGIKKYSTKLREKQSFWRALFASD